MYFDPVGSIEQRKYRLQQLKALSPTARSQANLMKLDPATFKVIEEIALKEARNNARNSGRLFATSYRDDAGRKITEYEGDIGAAFAPFIAGGQVCTINKDAGMREETIKLREGQRIQIVDG